MQAPSYQNYPQHHWGGQQNQVGFPSQSPAGFWTYAYSPSNYLGGSTQTYTATWHPLQPQAVPLQNASLAQAQTPTYPPFPQPVPQPAPGFAGGATGPLLHAHSAATAVGQFPPYQYYPPSGSGSAPSFNTYAVTPQRMSSGSQLFHRPATGGLW